MMGASGGWPYTIFLSIHTVQGHVIVLRREVENEDVKAGSRVDSRLRSENKMQDG